MGTNQSQVAAGPPLALLEAVGFESTRRYRSREPSELLLLVLRKHMGLPGYMGLRPLALDQLLAQQMRKQWKHQCRNRRQNRQSSGSR